VAADDTRRTAATHTLRSGVAHQREEAEVVRKKAEAARLERVRAADARQPTPPRRRTPRKSDSPARERPERAGMTVQCVIGTVLRCDW
jgi:hypothetical protein